jgi:predicted flavoprotein YhiN
MVKSISLIKPALGPFTFHQDDIEHYFKDLSGLSIEAIVKCHNQSFRENILITHKGAPILGIDAPPVAITNEDA